MVGGLTRQKARKTKNLLESYEDMHPVKTAEIITKAIVEPESEKLDELNTSLTEEIQQGESQDTYYLREWQTLCDHLSELESRYTELRKYKPSKTPNDVPLSEAEIKASGSMTVYGLRDDECAVIVCQGSVDESAYQKTRLKVVFTESPAVFFRKNLHPNRWFRPKDIKRAE